MCDEAGSDDEEYKGRLRAMMVIRMMSMNVMILVMVLLIMLDMMMAMLIMSIMKVMVLAAILAMTLLATPTAMAVILRVAAATMRRHRPEQKRRTARGDVT